ncbi:MAG: hypothetical protein L0H79_09740 [Intrasporangium sp.]|uniref:hypothetical protein n=1 Tax=Intrasporangium sp. TaxID=1925024 RepID=UPI0026482BA4|nr:hypothetical protein [Intrasporangium sp.]MDN5796016.1 hypothetical protein [Intrasporangium sp.]
MSEIFAGLSGGAAFLAFYFLWDYIREWRRTRSAEKKKAPISAGKRVSIPIEHEDAGNRELGDLPLGLNGHFTVGLAGSELVVSAATPALFGDPAIFWNRLLDDVRSAELAACERMGDMYVLARISFPTGGRVALRFARTDWDAICKAKVVR